MKIHEAKRTNSPPNLSCGQIALERVVFLLPHISLRISRVFGSFFRPGIHGFQKSLANVLKNLNWRKKKSGTRPTRKRLLVPADNLRPHLVGAQPTWKVNGKVRKRSYKTVCIFRKRESKGGREAEETDGGRRDKEQYQTEKNLAQMFAAHCFLQIFSCFADTPQKSDTLISAVRSCIEVFFLWKRFVLKKKY